VQRLSETFLILRLTERNIIINVHRPSCKIPVIFCQFLFELEFCRQIFEKYSTIKFHQNSSLGAELFHVDGRTDMTKVIVAFRNFANASENNHDTGRNCGKWSVYKYFYNAFTRSWSFNMLHTILNHCKIYVLTIPIRLFICITQWGVTQKWDTLSWHFSQYQN